MINTIPVKVDKNVSGLSWEVSDPQELAMLIGVLAVGQAAHAARILEKLVPNAPAVSVAAFNEAACAQLTIKSGLTEDQKKAAIAHRDGFLFECIAWIATRQSANDRTFLKDPHISATSQGLDGLMIELEPKRQRIKAVTICEEKCTGTPRKLFKSQVMPTFTEHHTGSKRSRELLATAVDIIKTNFADATAATQAAARVIDLDCRHYRAALTVSPSIVATATDRAALFADYKDLANIKQAQRIGATFVVDSDLRDWFEKLAKSVIAEIKGGKVKKRV